MLQKALLRLATLLMLESMLFQVEDTIALHIRLDVHTAVITQTKTPSYLQEP